MFLNKVILIGRSVNQPELRYTPTGVPVCNLRIAVPERYTTEAGQKRESTLFIDVSLWQRQAENCSRLVTKGKRVLVEGRLTQDEWVTPSGEKRIKFKILGQKVLVMDRIEAAPAQPQPQISQPPPEFAPPQVPEEIPPDIESYEDTDEPQL